MAAGDGDCGAPQATKGERTHGSSCVGGTWEDSVRDMDSLMCLPTIMAATVVEHQQNTCQ
jgi:hypothetical protein